jgi:hypothetical protein
MIKKDGFSGHLIISISSPLNYRIYIRPGFAGV